MYWSKIILFLAFILVAGGLQAQVQKQTPQIYFELYDSTYNFQDQGFTFSTINVLKNLNFVSNNYHSASFGAVDMATGSFLWNRTLKEDTTAGGGSSYSYCLAFNHYNDNTSSIRISDYDMDGYYLMDQDMNVILNFFDLGIRPENHGIAKLPDGRIAYLMDTTQVVNFYSNVIPDSTDWDALAFDLYIFNPLDSSTVKIFDWFSSVDSSFVVPEYFYEGDDSGPLIDWTHPNSVFADYDGNILISWRHLGVCKIDANTGLVIWWVGLPTGMATQQGFNEPTCISGDCRTRLQHDLLPVPGMPNHYSMFDNGDTARNYSRALFFSIDTANNTMQVEKDPNFERSDFMGSVAVLNNGSYLVNVPSIQKLPFGKFPAWMANGVFQDSILNYIHLLGSDIFLMDANDQLVAKYWSDSANFVYNNFIIDFSNWPEIVCEEDSVASTSYPSNFSWQNAVGTDLGSNLKQEVNESIYRLRFPYGILNGYTSYFDSKSCIGTSIRDEFSSVHFGLFPNPSQNTLKFSQYVESFDVFDLMGRYIFSGSGEFVDVSNLMEGVYFLNFTHEGAKLSAKFSKF